MKNILKTAFLLSMLLLPFQGFCSYISGCEKAEKFDHITQIGNESSEFAKCLLLVDLVEKTKNPEKKMQLKTILEVQILTFMDNILFSIERVEDGISWQNQCLESAISEGKSDLIIGGKTTYEYWSSLLQESLIGLEKLQKKYDKVKDLLKHTL